MLTFSLNSGSNGNSIYVETAGVRLLFDAGISGSLAQRRLAEHGRDIREVHALIISHDHVDHVRCAGIYQRKFGLPLYVTQATLRATWCNLGALRDVRYFRSGDVLSFNGVAVHTIPTAHDAADGVAFVVESAGKRLGILTDLGHPSPALQSLVETLDATYLECNYDPEMLECVSYPERLKARIRGPGGHLSNDESADLLRACARRRPRWIAVAHLSQENNLPELAIGAQHAAVGRSYPVYHASRHHVSEVLHV
ncbi:MAG: MBL fold metallo-hydrolase [Planctomycetes bacterium]|nr:MBL fold metallo-hydrolase [Planctomycetota bacterium]